MRAALREIVTLQPPELAECTVCGALGKHNHFDLWLDAHICVGCWSPLMVAQVEARAWMQVDALRSAEELRIAIGNFERAIGRVVRPFLPPPT